MDRTPLDGVEAAVSPKTFVATVLGVALALVLWQALGGKNVAWGKPVTASSTRFGYPGALTNGAIEWGTFGLHTNGGDAWAVIDLGAPMHLASARIYGRGDGHLTTGLPLRIELSVDGARYTQAAICDKPILQIVPCRVRLDGAYARYVRLHGPGVVLSEAEVFAAR